MDTKLLQNIKYTIFNYNQYDTEKQFSKYFYHYFRRLFDNPSSFDQYSTICKYIFYVTKSSGKRVLDIGCGFGLSAMHLAIYGSK